MSFNGASRVSKRAVGSRQGPCARLLFFQVSIRPGAPLVPPRPDPSTPAFLYVAAICIDKKQVLQKNRPALLHQFNNQLKSRFDQSGAWDTHRDA